MARLATQWLELMRSLGRSGLDLLAAELRAFVEDLGRSGRGLLRALLLLGIAAIGLFWATGVLIYALIALLAAAGLAPWQAAGVVFLALALATAFLAFWGWRRLSALESPSRTFNRRLDDHLDWWSDRVLEE